MTVVADLRSMEKPALEALQQELKEKVAAFAEKGLQLDMTRGKPCGEQLDLANEMLTCVTGDDFKAGACDTRNYGVVDGIPEAKALFAQFLEVGEDEVLVGGNSSLNLMFDNVARGMTHGMPGGEKPWGQQGTIKWLCPAPGYDRHFSVCEHFGIEMILVGMNDDGPDMDAVEKLVAEDASIKGIWCVPKYSNPTGITFSDAVVDRLASMKVAAPDFRIFWDNAYTVHHLSAEKDSLKNILTACKSAGNPDRVLLFGSTSKVSFAGAGVGVMGGSRANLDAVVAHMQMQTIGSDKVNQLRHVRFFKDMAGVEAHMAKHADIIRPKFEAVLEILQRDLGDCGIATWNAPRGGYFVSLDVLPGCAKKVVSMAAEAGVKLTSAGATFPYKKDPEDKNIRIAPTLPELADIREAMDLLTTLVRLTAVEQLTQ
ncbi:MAG: PLP-dependent aminotransferase family protein [Planctomycetota bacterium]|jgi:aspartate/methionine/tyrosine aminotransferase